MSLIKAKVQLEKNGQVYTVIDKCKVERAVIYGSYELGETKSGVIVDGYLLQNNKTLKAKLVLPDDIHVIFAG